MNAFRKGLLALFVLSLVSVAPVASLASTTSKATVTAVAQAPMHGFSFDLIPTAMAQEPSPSPVPGPSGIGGIAQFLSDLADKIPLNGVVIMVILFILDFVRRKWPTAVPTSLLRDIQSLFRGLGKLLNKLDQFLDQIIGQNVK